MVMSPRIAANSPWVCSEPDCQNPVSTPTTLRCRACWAKSEHRRVALSTCAMDGCDAPIRSKGLCERHYRRPSDDRHHKQRNRCSVCDVPINDGSTLCRAHYLAAKTPKKTCACGAVLAKRSAEQCRECWMRDHMAATSRPKCRDCGKPISWQVGQRGTKATRCMPCHTAYRASLPKRLCSLEGCDLPHLAQGYCRNHYTAKNDSRGIRAYLKALPCAVCGLDDPDVIQIDRAVRDLGYTWGNVVQVCANCHQKITLGKIERPPPWEGPPPGSPAIVESKRGREGWRKAEVKAGRILK